LLEKKRKGRYFLGNKEEERIGEADK